MAYDLLEEHTRQYLTAAGEEASVFPKNNILN